MLTLGSFSCSSHFQALFFGYLSDVNLQHLVMPFLLLVKVCGFPMQPPQRLATEM